MSDAAPLIAPVRGTGPRFPSVRGLFAAAAPYTLITPGLPYRALNTGKTYYYVWIDPAFDKRYTVDGMPFGWCIRKGMIDTGLLCGLRWWQVTDPAKAHFRFGLRTGREIERKNLPGTGSGYLHAVRGGRDILLGDVTKPAQGSRPPGIINYTRWAMHAWGIAIGFWAYDGGGHAPTDAMACANFSAPIQAPRWGYSAAELKTLAYFGPRWLAL